MVYIDRLNAVVAIREGWMRFVLGLLLFALTTVPLRAAEPLTSVPYGVAYNGWFTIGVKVNGEGPYDFIVDTGATRSLVFQNLADELVFTPTGGPEQTVLGLSAQGTFQPYLIGDLQIGDERLDGLISVILPDWALGRRPQGVLGLDFLRKYIVVFDAELEELRLYHKSDPPRDDIRRWKKVRLKADTFGLDTQALYKVTGLANRSRVYFLLDLGASGTIINKAAVVEIIQSGTQLLVRPAGERRTRITDALRKSETAQSIRITRFRAGNVYWNNHIFVIHDAAIFEDLGVADQPFGLFGADLLRKRSFSLDFEGGEMRIGPRRRRR